MTNGNSYLHFDGVQTYIEIPSSATFSVPTTGSLTVSAWIRPSTLTFPQPEGTGYVHWLGKGEKGQQEWVFRMYSQGNAENRGNRISFYVFNPQGHLGVGSYFQDDLQIGVWIHVVGVADGASVFIYKDGLQRDTDDYAGKIAPAAGRAPLRIGTRDLNSYFQGEIREVRIWNRVLTQDEIANLYSAGTVPRDGLAAEYLLTQDVVLDTADIHDGHSYGACWISQSG